jgi:hypothetical protein
MKALLTCLVHASIATMALAQATAPVATATTGLTVMPTGPRSGDPGSRYFNVQGKDNDKYASFGVLAFDVPKEAQGTKPKALTLTLVQSVPSFARDGGIKFFLAPEFDAKAALKFDPGASDGVGDQIKPLHGLGSGEFKKVATGKTDMFSLKVDDVIQERIAKGGKLYLVVVPADATVSATYFGAGDDVKDKAPRLTIVLP